MKGWNSVLFGDVASRSGVSTRMLRHYNKRMKEVTLKGERDAPKSAFGNDDRLRPKEVVAGLRVGMEEKAYPFSQLRIARVVMAEGFEPKPGSVSPKHPTASPD